VTCVRLDENMRNSRLANRAAVLLLPVPSFVIEHSREIEIEKFPSSFKLNNRVRKMDSSSLPGDKSRSRDIDTDRTSSVSLELCPMDEITIASRIVSTLICVTLGARASLLLFTFTFHRNYNRARQLNFAKSQTSLSRATSVNSKIQSGNFWKISSPPDALESARHKREGKLAV